VKSQGPSALRALMRAAGIIVQPAIYNGLSARIAEDAGFKAIGLGGYAMGASMAVSEPLLSLEDVARFTREVTTVSSLPVMVDIGTGYGEPVHVRHSVRSIENAGGAAIHIEDQWYPKRVHYHQGVEHVVPLDEMLMRVDAAVKGRRDDDFVICARTDAMRTDGYEEGIRRAAACMEAGADLIMMFPNNEEETRQAPKDLPGVPLVYVNSSGNRLNRGVFNVSQLEEWGWKMVSDAIATTNVTALALRSALSTLASTGETGLDGEEMRATRKYVEDAIGLDELYDIERRTVEHD
jgi:2-methylisocitrate lyase-like PEP mutase family enzyme